MLLSFSLFLKRARDPGGGPAAFPRQPPDVRRQTLLPYLGNLGGRKGSTRLFENVSGSCFSLLIHEKLNRHEYLMGLRKRQNFLHEHGESIHSFAKRMQVPLWGLEKGGIFMSFCGCRWFQSCHNCGVCRHPGR